MPVMTSCWAARSRSSSWESGTPSSGQSRWLRVRARRAPPRRRGCSRPSPAERDAAVPGAAGDVRAERLVEVDLDAADRVDQVFEAGEVDDRDVVDLDPEEVLDRLDLQLRAAEGVGGVDLLRRLAGDLGEDVARDREFAEGAAAGADQHQRVGAELAADLGRGAARCRLLEALLRRRLGLVRQSGGRASVPRTRIVCGLTAGSGLPLSARGAVGELELLQLSGDREGEEAEQDPAEERRAAPSADQRRPPSRGALGGFGHLGPRRLLLARRASFSRRPERSASAAGTGAPGASGRPCSRALGSPPRGVVVVHVLGILPHAR